MIMVERGGGSELEVRRRVAAFGDSEVHWTVSRDMLYLRYTGIAVRSVRERSWRGYRGVRWSLYNARTGASSSTFELTSGAPIEPDSPLKRPPTWRYEPPSCRQ